MWTMDISNTCQCAHCTNGDCGLWTEYAEYDAKCDSCGSDLAPADCNGTCWDDAQTYAYGEVREWLEANKSEAYYVKGSNMHWTGISGQTDVQTDPAKALSLLSINGEYNLRFKREGDTLTVVRTSHDELGALFEFFPVPNAGICDSCGERSIVKKYMKHDDAFYWCNNCDEEEGNE